MLLLEYESTMENQLMKKMMPSNNEVPSDWYRCLIQVPSSNFGMCTGILVSLNSFVITTTCLIYGNSQLNLVIYTQIFRSQRDFKNHHALKILKSSMHLALLEVSNPYFTDIFPVN